MAEAQPRRSFARHALVYGVGNLLVCASGFVLLPLYTRCLVVEEFGTLELLSRVVEVMNLCLLFPALRQATIAFYGQSTTDLERRRVLSTLVVVLVGGALLGTAVMGLLGVSLTGFIGAGRPGLLGLACVAGLLEGACFVLLAVPQAREQSGRVVLISTSQLVVRVVLAVLFVVIWRQGVAGVLAASAITSGLIVLWLVIDVLLAARTWPSRKLLVSYLHFCLPFLPGGLGLFVLNNGDRFLVQRYCGVDDVGSYALGYKLAAAVTTFSFTPLMMVWGARMYAAAREENAAAIFGQVMTRVLAAYVLLGLGVCLFQDEIIGILAGQAYPGAAAVIAPVVLGYGFLAAVSVMDAGFYIHRRTLRKTLVTLAAAGVVTLLYLALIPRFGALGAAYATVGGFAFQAVLTRLVSQRLFRIRYEDGRLLAMIGSAVLLWSLSRLLPAAPWSTAVRGGLWLAWPILLWTTGLIRSEEKAWVCAQLRVLTGSCVPIMRRMIRPLPLGQRPRITPGM
jgi:O-antigen/teichoic acid export membrane protein